MSGEPKTVCQTGGLRGRNRPRTASRAFDGALHTGGMARLGSHEAGDRPGETVHPWNRYRNREKAGLSSAFTSPRQTSSPPAGTGNLLTLSAVGMRVPSAGLWIRVDPLAGVKFAFGCPRGRRAHSTRWPRRGRRRRTRADVSAQGSRLSAGVAGGESPARACATFAARRETISATSLSPSSFDAVVRGSCP